MAVGWQFAHKSPWKPSYRRSPRQCRGDVDLPLLTFCSSYRLLGNALRRPVYFGYHMVSAFFIPRTGCVLVFQKGNCNSGVKDVKESPLAKTALMHCSCNAQATLMSTSDRRLAIKYTLRNNVWHDLPFLLPNDVILSLRHVYQLISKPVLMTILFLTNNERDRKSVV